MGSYCELYLNGYQIEITKNYIHAFWNRIFKERNRVSRQVHFSEYYTKVLYHDDLVPTSENCLKVSVVKMGHL